VIVLKHPLHDVTGDDGTFRIEGLPAGEQLKISAWHPLFQETSVRVQLEPGEEKRVELVITPAQSAGEAATEQAEPGQQAGAEQEAEQDAEQEAEAEQPAGDTKPAAQ
jgi:hypothetical protein